MRRSLVVALLLLPTTSALAAPVPTLGAMLQGRLRSAILTARVKVAERRGTAAAKRALAELPEAMTTAAEIYVESPLRRRALASLAREYRALRDAAPGTLAARRRDQLAPGMGTLEALRGRHDPSLRGANDGVAHHAVAGERPVVSVESMPDRRLVNVLAHEMKHLRDRPLEDAAIARTEALLDENDRLLGAPATPATQETVRRNLRAIERLQRYTSRAGEETRAYRAGGFAQGVLGRSLARQHRTGEYVAPGSADYPAEQLGMATLRGYLAGSKRALRGDARFRATSGDRRAMLSARIAAYTYGYGAVASAQVGKSLYVAPSPGGVVRRALRASLSAIGRAIGWLDQKLRPIGGADAAYEAGRRDAERELRPLARASRLLR